MILICILVAARLSLTNRDPSGWAIAAVFAGTFDLTAAIIVFG